MKGRGERLGARVTFSSVEFIGAPNVFAVEVLH